MLRENEQRSTHDHIKVSIAEHARGLSQRFNPNTVLRMNRLLCRAPVGASSRVPAASRPPGSAIGSAGATALIGAVKAP